MPRNYRRLTSRNTWTENQLKEAITAIEQDKKSIRAAGREFNIPESTIRKRLREQCTSRNELGRKPVFNNAEEEELENLLQRLAANYYELTPSRIRRVAYDFAEAKGLKHNFNKVLGLAGKDWYHLFLHRHPSIILKQSDSSSLQGITDDQVEEVKQFYSNLKEVIRKFSFLPHRIFNMDEIEITFVQNECTEVNEFTKLGEAGAANNAKKEQTITAFCCMNASGIYTPPMLISPRQSIRSQSSQNDLSKFVNSNTKTGGTNVNLYLRWLEYFKNLVKPSLKSPVLLVLDDRYSHISLDAVKFIEENSIVVVTLPPLTSHKLQPLDITFFGPLKNTLYKEYKQYLATSNQKEITDYNFAELFHNAYIKVASKETSVSGFQRAGIWPFNQGRFAQNRLLAPLVPRNFLLDAQSESPTAISSEHNLIEDEPSASAAPSVTYGNRPATMHTSSAAGRSKCGVAEWELAKSTGLHFLISGCD